MRILTTARLRLLPWEDRFKDDLVRLSADPRVTRYIGDGRPWGRDFAVQRHRAHLAHWAEHGFGWRAIVRDDEFIGIAALNRLGQAVPGIDESAIEVGWWLDPRVWGRGFATEAALALRDEAFTHLGAERLVARFQSANLASERVMTKLGMTRHGDTVGRAGERVRVYVLDRAAWRGAGSGQPMEPRADPHDLGQAR
ncbi:MAG: GNAT family N-acetyltransferase [Gaiellaceae bacterium]